MVTFNAPEGPFRMLTVRSRLSPPGEVGAVKFHGVDLLQHSPSPSPSPGDSYPQQPHSLELFTDTPHQNLPIRKTHSELDTTLPTGWFNCQKNISLDSVTGFFCNISINTFFPLPTLSLCHKSCCFLPCRTHNIILGYSLYLL